MLKSNANIFLKLIWKISSKSVVNRMQIIML